MGIIVQEVDTRAASESLLREMYPNYARWDQELVPDDRPEPFEMKVAEWRAVPEHIDLRHWILREGDRIVGVAWARMNRVEDLNNGVVFIHVLPEARRRGLATRLAGPVLGTLADNDRGSVIVDVVDGVEWEGKLEAMGLKKVLQERISRLIIGEVDWDLMDQWVDRASAGAADYDLLRVRTPIPEEYLQNWCELMLVMNTAPREELAFEDFEMTPGKWREIEKTDLARGRPLLACVAVHRPTGTFVGLSEIQVLEHDPEIAYQGDTGVDPSHRNRGLGRWLKAEMIRWLADERPQVERVYTGNAGSNEPMLAINVEMGYRPAAHLNAWQGDVATVRERLGV